MHEAAKLKAANPKITQEALLKAVGYTETSAMQGRAAFLKTPQFDYWVKVYSGLEHIQHITGLKDVVALAPLQEAYLREMIDRVSDPKKLSSMKDKDIMTYLMRIAELTAKATSTMSEETKQAVTDLMEAESNFKKYLPDDFKLNDELIN